MEYLVDLTLHLRHTGDGPFQADQPQLAGELRREIVLIVWTCFGGTRIASFAVRGRSCTATLAASGRMASWLRYSLEEIAAIVQARLEHELGARFGPVQIDNCSVSCNVSQERGAWPI